MQLQNTLVLAIVLSAGRLAAQPTLAQPDDGFAPTGSPYAVTSFTTTTPSQFVPPGNDGADQVYGFWMVETTGNYDRHLVAPSVTSSSANFPGATVLSTNGGQDTAFYRVDANGVELLGIRGSLEGIAPYSDPALELKYPCTFGTTWNDAFSSTYMVSGFTVNRAGTINGNADGYGSIQLPGQELDDILRVKVRKVQFDQSPILSAYRTFDTYYYYQSGIRYPVMKTSVDTVIIGSGSAAVTFTAEWLYGPGEVGIGTIDASQVVFTPYPNPTTGLLDLRVENGDVRSVEVFDGAGLLVRTLGSRATDRSTGLLDLGGLSAGLYHVRVTGMDGRRGTQRVVLH